MAKPSKIVQLVCTGHSDIVALTEDGRMWERAKDTRDMNPKPRYLWKEILGPFDEPPPQG